MIITGETVLHYVTDADSPKERGSRLHSIQVVLVTLKLRSLQMNKCQPIQTGRACQSHKT